MTNTEIPSAHSDEDVLHDIIDELQRRHDEMNEKKVDDIEKHLNIFKDTVWATLYTELSSRDIAIKESMDSLRQLIPLCKDGGLADSSIHCNFDYSSVDDKIKLATESVHNSIRDLISSNLGHLALIEEEVAKLTLQLAERPDDSQINKMILDLDQVVSDRIGKTEIFQTILDSMKQGTSHSSTLNYSSLYKLFTHIIFKFKEMRKKMTKDEVITLVQALFNNAKDDIKNNSNSLMIGRVPYRCIGCDRLFAFGVNDKIATKVNHDALPFCLAPRVSLKIKSRYPDLCTTESRPIKNRPKTACDAKFSRQGSSVPKDVKKANT